MTSLNGLSVTKTHSNYRVVINPRNPWHRGGWTISGMPVTGDEWQEICDEIISDVNRHVDRVASAEIKYDTEISCAHCGHKLVGDTDPKYGYECCNAHVEEWKAAHKVTK